MSRMQKAEQHIREYTCLYRHYCIDEVKASVERGTGIALNNREAIHLVQKLRNENNMGQIESDNLPDMANATPNGSNLYEEGWRYCFICECGRPPSHFPHGS